MNRGAIIATVGAFAAGAAAAYVGARATARREPDRAGAELRELGERVAGLEREVGRAEAAARAAQELADEAIDVAYRVRREAGRPGAEPAAAGSAAAVRAPSPAEAAPAQPRAELPAAGARVAAASPTPPPPEEVERVRAALEVIRAEERDERESVHEARFNERLQRRLEEVSARLGLQPPEREALGRIWQEDRARREEMFRTVREGAADPAEARAVWQKVRAESAEMTRALLGEPRYAEYQKWEADRRGERGGWGGWFGGPP